MSHFDASALSTLDQLVVRHAQFEAAQSAIEEAVQEAASYSDKSLLPLIGPSRSGKSRLLEDYLATHHPPGAGKGQSCPVRSFVMPRSTRPRAMLMKLQCMLGHPFYAVGTETQMLIRLPLLLRGLGVKVLFVDELQHCVSRRGAINYDLADIFKVMLDEAQVTIVAAGLENAADVLEANEQLSGRCLQAVRLPRFDWIDPESRAEFMSLIHGFIEGLPMLQMPPLLDEDGCFRWYVACGGLVGYLHKIFRKLLSQLQREDRSVATLEDIDRAHAASVYYRGQKLRPFDRKFAVGDIVTGLTHAARIGERCEPAPVATGLAHLPARQRKAAMQAGARP